MSARYTIVIGTKNWSSWSLRPYLALRATGAPFEEIVLRLRRPDTSAQIRQYSSAGKVPVLKIVEHGHTATVWESLAICETLAERHKDAGLWPDDAEQRARARSISSEMHSGFPALRAKLPMDFVRSHPTPDLDEETSTQIARIIAAWTKQLSRNPGDGYLFGRFSIADCMYAPVVSRFLTYGIELPPALRAYCARMMALPAMQDWGRAAEAEVDAGLA